MPHPCAALFLVTSFAATALAGQDSYTVPRTADGHPDLQGVWATEFATPLERASGVEELVVSPARAESMAGAIMSGLPDVQDPDFELSGVNQLVRVKGEYRTSIIVEPANGKLPYSEAGLALAKEVIAGFNQYDDPEQRPLPERCLENFGYAPIRAIPLFLPRRIFQTRDHVVIYSEDAVGLRLIRLNQEPPPEEIRSIEGESIGHWEGDTLVVETTHLRAEHPYRSGFGRPLLLSPETRIEERFRRVSETELFYRYTVEDARLYTEPWTGELSMTRYDGPLFDYACHEGNYSLPSILRGGQLVEDEAAEADGENGADGDSN